MPKGKLLFSLVVLVIIMTGCSKDIEKEIVGTWQNAGEEGDCDTNMDEEITFTSDGEVIGIEGYNKYDIQKTESENYDYAILSGGLEDNAKYRVKIDDDNHLHIVYEENDTYDFDSQIACNMVKDDK